jgi:hypothetical protein
MTRVALALLVVLTLASAALAAGNKPARTLLPDLVVRPQRNLGFDPGGLAVWDEMSTEYPTCYRSEVEEEGARLCLRFDQIFANAGEGALELRFTVPKGTKPPTRDAFQRVFRSDGSASDVLVGEVELHGTHGHYHFTSFGLSSLWTADSSGRKTASQPLRIREPRRAFRTNLVREARKTSFCMADVELDGQTQQGAAQFTYDPLACLTPAESDGTTDLFVQGLSRGWIDVYEWYLPDQYVEVSGVPDGDYILQTVADPDGLLHESSKRNNCGSVHIRLSNMTSPTPAVVLVGPGPRCGSTLRAPAALRLGPRR